MSHSADKVPNAHALKLSHTRHIQQWAHSSPKKTKLPRCGNRSPACITHRTSSKCIVRDRSESQVSGQTKKDRCMCIQSGPKAKEILCPGLEPGSTAVIRSTEKRIY